MAKASFNKEKNFHQQIVLKFKEETIKVLHLKHSFVYDEDDVSRYWMTLRKSEDTGNLKRKH